MTHPRPGARSRSLLLTLTLAAAGCSGTTESDRAGAAGGGGAKPDASSDASPDSVGPESGTWPESGTDTGVPLPDASHDGSGDEEPACGNGTCDPGEDCANCLDDCPCPPTCPNGTCDPGEDCQSCPGDCECTSSCPSGTCDTSESCESCPSDCGACSEADALFKCDFDPMQWWRGPTSRDITFVAIGDVHASVSGPGCSVNSSGAPDHNDLARDAINSVGAHVWPAGASFYREGQPYDHVRGVLIAGDLTQAGSEPVPAGGTLCREYTEYRRAYGRCGSENKLLFPVYDGYGNHDFPRNPAPGDVDYHPVIDYLDLITANHRPGLPTDLYDDPTAGTGHYAWRWDDIWFFNLNLKPGWKLEYIEGTANDTMRIADAHAARGFLKSFLLAQPTSAKRQIVLMAHYPIDSSRIDDEERESFCRLIHNAQVAAGDFEGKGQKLSTTSPVIAYLHGHTHGLPSHHDFTCPSPYGAITIPQFNVGTPLYEAAKQQGLLHFTVVRIGTTRLEVVGVSAPASNPTGPWTYVYKERLAYPLAP